MDWYYAIIYYCRMVGVDYRVASSISKPVYEKQDNVLLVPIAETMLEVVDLLVDCITVVSGITDEEGHRHIAVNLLDEAMLYRIQERDS